MTIFQKKPLVIDFKKDTVYLIIASSDDSALALSDAIKKMSEGLTDKPRVIVVAQDGKDKIVEKVITFS